MHLVGFITKKFVTMYSHMNVKFDEERWLQMSKISWSRFSRLSSLPVYRCLNVLSELYTCNTANGSQLESKENWLERKKCKKATSAKDYTEWLFSCLNKCCSFVCFDITTLFYCFVLLREIRRVAVRGTGWLTVLHEGTQWGKQLSCFSNRWILSYKTSK